MDSIQAAALQDVPCE